MQDQQEELLRQFRNQQEKYAYYIIALSVTSIGFAIVKTTEQYLKWTQIPVGISVLSWGMSIYCGLRFLNYTISNLYTNNEYFNILAGRNPDVGQHPEAVKAAARGIWKAMEINSSRASKFATWQDRFFYIGIISFIVWHVLEMYNKSVLQ